MNRLLAVSGIAVILGGFVMLMLPATIPLLDANRELLAESERQGFCAGEVYVQTRGAGDEAAMGDCIATSTLDDARNYERVQPAFCVGLVEAGFEIPVEECIQIMQERQFWPTLKGQLTVSWNRKFPYPLDTFTTAKTGGDPTGRTNDRPTNDREDLSR